MYVVTFYLDYTRKECIKLMASAGSTLRLELISFLLQINLVWSN